MPNFHTKGYAPWNVTKLAGGSPHVIQNKDGSPATRFGGVYVDSAQAGVVIAARDVSPTGDIGAGGNRIWNSSSQAANTLDAVSDGGVELKNGLIITHAIALVGGVYVYWK